VIFSVELSPWEAGGGEWGEYWEVVSREFNKSFGGFSGDGKGVDWMMKIGWEKGRVGKLSRGDYSSGIIWRKVSKLPKPPLY